MTDAKKRSFEQSPSQELARLAAQDALHQPFTEQLLRATGLRPGMRVLDLGCGAGDTALLAAQLVGNEGCVVGIDDSSAKVDFCRRRAAEAGHANVRFEVSKIEDYQEPLFDVVFGRYILMHCADPCSVVRAAAKLVAPNGVIAFHEVDLHFSACTSHPEAPVFDAEARKLAGVPDGYLPSPDVAVRLVEVFQQAGLPRPEQLCARPVAGPDPTAFCTWFSGYASKLHAYLNPDLAPLDIERHRRLICEDILATGSQVAGFDQWMAWAKVIH